MVKNQRGRGGDKERTREGRREGDNRRGKNSSPGARRGTFRIDGRQIVDLDMLFGRTIAGEGASLARAFPDGLLQDAEGGRGSGSFS
ncbi:hypothetical protein AAC387_Pa02g1616 [Persea americana]